MNTSTLTPTGLGRPPVTITPGTKYILVNNHSLTIYLLLVVDVVVVDGVQVVVCKVVVVVVDDRVIVLVVGSCFVNTTVEVTEMNIIIFLITLCKS